MASNVIYFDEIKPNPRQGEHRYIIGGLGVPMEEIPALEQRLSEISERIFGTSEMTNATEFHASWLYSGKAHFKGMPAADRVALLAELGEVITSNKAVGRIYARVHTDRRPHVDAGRAAFAFFCERAQLWTGRNGVSLLLGDLDDQQSRQMISEFSRYRREGTPWGYGIEVPSLIDAVHFARSHHSRLIQLADVYLFLSAHSGAGRSGWHADALTKAIKGLELYAHRYKDWPAT